MCGIAGMFDLAGRRDPPKGMVRRMADAIYHRGPDEDGYLDRPGLSLANRRLSIVGLADGKQPISNEDGTIWTVFNGEFFDYPEKKAMLEAKGHVFRTTTDTELIPHMYEEYGEGMFQHMRGQFAICIWDSRQNRVLLARDRMGICPLFWSLQPGRGEHAGTHWLMFASEMKALLASGHVERKANPHGINQIFSFFAVPGPMTCFAGIDMILPGRYLDIRFNEANPTSAVQQKIYWEIDFPDRGHELQLPHDQMVDRFEATFKAAVDRRLRADVPVVSYLSGGVDSSVVVAVASKVLGRPIPTFTIAIQKEGLNEESEAAQTAKHLGTKSIVMPYGDAEVRTTYPDLIRAAEVPVVDTSCAALMMLAKTVRDNGFKVALTGEGADETLAGYHWFRIHKIVSKLDMFGIPLSLWLKKAVLKLTGQPMFSNRLIAETADLVGGHNGWLDLYGVMSLNKLRFYNPEMKAKFADYSPYHDLQLNRDRLRKWHPFNRSIYLGQKIMLAGHLLSSKGDRVAMNSSVETRYPFLDEDMVDLTAKIDPSWKLRGMREKYLLRCMAARWLPKETAWRRKAMFRAPLDSFHTTGPDAPRWIEEVLSPESLRKTNLFDIEAVQRHRRQLEHLSSMSPARTSIELGLVAVVATQLWHHIWISGGLSSLETSV